MKLVLITGTSSGIGKATAKKFISEGWYAVGLDIKPQSFGNKRYLHFICDVSQKEQLPDLKKLPDVIVNNAGTLNEEDALRVNLQGYINVAEKYAFHSGIKSVLDVCSISAYSGIETPNYVSSQGGRLSYTKYLTLRLGNQYKATVNSISPGAVLTELDKPFFELKGWQEDVANENILKKWSTADEMSEWIYFITVVNKSMTGQDVIIDNGEFANYNFIDGKDYKK
jgi:3-oxoacyl-[acyl-carrier protein] reductase